MDESSSESQNQAVTAFDPWDDRERPQLRLDEIISRAANAYPDRLAVIDGDERRTYSELDADVDALCAGFRRIGIALGARVAVAVPTGLSAVTTLYALARIGAIAVPLNELWSSREMVDVLGRSASGWVVADDVRAAPDASLAMALATVPSEERPQLGVLTSPRQVRLLEDEEPVSATMASEDVGSPDDVALLLFTSGSTSAPKGALLTHAALVGSAHYLALACAIGPDDRLIQVLPAYHVGGIVDGILLMHIVGGTCISLRFDAERILELFETEGATFLSAFDSMIDTVLRSPRYSPKRHPRWRVALTTTKGEDYDQLKAIGVERIITGFGMTETSSNWATTRMTQTEDRRRNSEWVPFPGVEVLVVDPNTGAQCPTGAVGELRVRGWNVMSAYLDGDTGRDAAGFFCTGDLGRLHADGTVTFAGRLKGIIKTGGENVIAHEVEQRVLEEISAVRAAVVVGVPDERWGEMVVAFIEVDASCRLDDEEIRERCRGAMAGFKLPKHFFRVAPGNWPLMAAGKVDRPALTRMASQRLEDQARNDDTVESCG